MASKSASIRVTLDNLDVSERLRPVDGAWVEALASSMEEHGLEQPVVVVKLPAGRKKLVAGAHRVAAARLLGWQEIDAIERDITETEARLIEIDENLMRRELNALDRAVFMLERKRIYEELYPETMHGKAPKSKVERLKAEQDGEKSQGLRLFPKRFTAEAAERVGLSERLVQLAVSIAQNLTPKAIDLLRSTPLASNQAALLALCEESATDQVRIAKLIASGEAKGIGPAKIALGMSEEVKRDEQARLWAQFLAIWEKANKRTRKSIAEHIQAGG